jgi:hypothetical protein
MNNFLRTIIAGYGAKKLGGGCFSTILVFVIIYWALGTCNKQPVQTRPANIYKPAKMVTKNLNQKPEKVTAQLILR